MEADLRSVYVGNVCDKELEMEDFDVQSRLIILRQHKNWKIIFMVVDRFIV